MIKEFSMLLVGTVDHGTNPSSKKTIKDFLLISSLASFVANHEEQDLLVHTQIGALF